MRNILISLAVLALLGAAAARGSHSHHNHEGYHDSDADEHVANAESTGTRPKCKGNNACGTKGDFDTYLFSQWWPSTNCADDNCNRDKYAGSLPGFTIHGLWPQYAEKGWPQWCEGDETRREDIDNLDAELRKDLEKYWPDVRKDGRECGNSPGGMYRENQISSEGFWFCEWKKHGACSDYKTPAEYYKAAVDFRKSFDLEQIIIDNSNGAFDQTAETVDFGIVEAATTKHFGEEGHIVFVCKGGKVTEVRMCLDKSLKSIKCPASVLGAGSCSGNVNFRRDLDSEKPDPEASQ